MLSQGKVFDDRDERRLLVDELSLLQGMTDTGRPGFALQLKFRQVQGHYPDPVHDDFPSGIVHTIAERVGCTSVSPENYPFQGRQAQRHRQHIRRYLGVRLPSKADIARLKAWLTEFILPLIPQAVRGNELDPDCCQELLIERSAPMGASTAALLPQPSFRSCLTSTPVPSDSPTGREVGHAPPPR